jgi:hypothetical protein
MHIRQNKSYHNFTDEVRLRLKIDKMLVGEDRPPRLNEATANARELYDAMLELLAAV